jgi:hypothetical protein
LRSDIESVAVDVGLEHFPADVIAGFDYQYIVAGALQCPCGNQSTQSRPTTITSPR